jgi:hypothetical protein
MKCKKTNKRTNKRTNKKKNKKTSKRISKGGAPEGYKFIAKGAYGCVYSPALKCLDKEIVSISDDKTISKLMVDTNAYGEFIENIILKILGYDIENNFHLPLPTSCQLNIKTSSENKENQKSDKYDERDFSECEVDKFKKNDKTTILTYKDGGIDFYQLRKKTNYHPQNIFSKDGLPKILDGIIALQEKGLIHGDIKDQNIVTGFFDDENNPGKTDFKLIDFGLLTFTGEKDIGVFLYNQDISPEILKIIKDKDILTGPQKKYDERRQIFEYNHIYYPVYGFIFYSLAFHPDYIDFIDDISSADNERVIDHFLSQFKANIQKYPQINDYFKQIQYGDNKNKSMRDSLLDLNNELIESYKGEDKTEYNNNCLILAKKIDYYSFGILLLIYIEHIQNIYPTLKALLVQHIYDFLNNSELLFINFSKLEPIKIKEQFNTMCDNIMNGITQKGGYLPESQPNNKQPNNKQPNNNQPNNNKKLNVNNNKKLNVNNNKKLNVNNNTKSFPHIEHEITPELQKEIETILNYK